MSETPPPYQPQPPQQPPNQPPYPQGGLTPDERTWGGAAHWSALVGAVRGAGLPGPLLVLLLKGSTSPYVRRQAVESLNFQLSMFIYGAISFVLVFVLVGFVLLAVVGVLWLVFTIIGSVRPADGEEYRYPLTIRMVS